MSQPFFVAEVFTGRRRQVRARSRTRSRRSRRSSKARPTTCRSRRSSSPARSTTFARTPRSWRADRCHSISRSSRRSGWRTRTTVDLVRVPGERGRARHPAASCAARVDARRRGAADPQGRRRGVVRDRRRVPPGAAGQGRGDGRDRRPRVARSTSRRRRRPDARRSGRSRSGPDEPADLAAARAQLQRRCSGSGSPSAAPRGSRHVRAKAGDDRNAAALARGARVVTPSGAARWLTRVRSTGNTGPSRSPARVPRSRAAAPLTGRADQRGEERRAEAARRRHPDRRALPVHERPRDRGRAGHGRHAARPRRRRRPPGAERLRGRLGRRRLAVRAARGRGQDARQLHPARAAADAASAG